ncbi:MAG TPA: hypothetical protein VMS32_11410 [Verrucomicrobiae bacterium]|nr:hypothetical protein [Verrucomicrobiae bacterium]
MPVVLSQRTWHDDPKYLDREGVIYHYPRQYRSRIGDYEKFIYYRPADGASAEEASTYIGHGVLGASFDDPFRSDHSYVPIAWYEPFVRPVQLREGSGIFIETENLQKPQFQSAARPVRETAYFRILMHGGISSGREFSPLVTSETAMLSDYLSPIDVPMDLFREIHKIPEGTGYVPSGKALPSVYESAALQERARKDHNWTLELIRRRTESLGGSTWYNNNVDLYARVGERRFLIEAKSLNDPAGAVDRMRYGMGQLFDYRVRYKSEMADAESVLAFGAPPDRRSSFVSTILQENRIAFVAKDGESIVPLNERARRLPFCA